MERKHIADFVVELPDIADFVGELPGTAADFVDIHRQESVAVKERLDTIKIKFS